ncbi:hydrogenase nickel incorporation protein HypA [Pelotomaculum propionicicum]|uniref:Hydrogenase maturation factor HypA n=1 Tax=Pelotomaculum propionicicum TaxID=258475 RepID=A0A4Y7RST7_9FIRM|nr:hydrogenase nickel incorporation protein HypA [Pelotomaculum propionicicum]NLI13941.1 hydrogenase nickel incorporation protein HypA [Peptococcaceae bacterium]TEB12045.1 hydrogenase nickel incorporation protein HypA [Pelotomaculum propionicicum]
MHEWALAEAVVETVLKEAGKENLKEIVRVKVMVGELQQIELDVFNFAMENILQQGGGALSMEKISLEVDKCVLRCKVCGEDWYYSDSLQDLSEEDSEAIHFVPEVAHVYVRCPRCGSPDFEITSGRGVWIDYIEGEK